MSKWYNPMFNPTDLLLSLLVEVLAMARLQPINKAQVSDR